MDRRHPGDGHRGRHGGVHCDGVPPGNYEGRATLLVGQSLESGQLDYDQILAAQLQAQTYAAIATDRSVLETTIETLGLDMTPEQLARQTEASAASGSRFVTILATDGDPNRAADIANGIAEHVIALTAADTTDEILAAIRLELAATEAEVASVEADLEFLAQESPSADVIERRSELTTQLLTLRSIRAQLLAEAAEGSTSPLAIVSRAAPSAEPAGPRPILNALLAAVVGIIAATAIVFVIDRQVPAAVPPAPTPRAKGSRKSPGPLAKAEQSQAGEIPPP